MEQVWTILTEQGPIVVVLSVVGVFMYRQFNTLITQFREDKVLDITQLREDLKSKDITIKEKDAVIQKLNDDARDDNKENLKLLSEFSNLLDKVLTNTQTIEGNVINGVNTSIEKLKNHIDIKIMEIKNKN